MNIVRKVKEIFIGTPTCKLPTDLLPIDAPERKKVFATLDQWLIPDLAKICTEYLYKNLTLTQDYVKATKEFQNNQGVMYQWAYEGKIRPIECVLASGVNVDDSFDSLRIRIDHTLYSIQSRVTLLMISVQYNNCDLVKFLIENGANVNASEDEGYTALHYVAFCGKNNAKMCRMLLNAGANVYAKSKHGTTPLMCAVSYRCADLYEMLSASFQVKNNQLNDALDRATTNQNYPAITYLLGLHMTLPETNNTDKFRLLQAAQMLPDKSLFNQLSNRFFK